MLERFFKIGGIIVLVAFLAGTLAFTSIKYNNAPCTGIEIEYEADDVISIDKESIRNMILSADKNILGHHFDSINIAMLEVEVEKHPAILNAEICEMVKRDSTSYRGVLQVKVKHREPIVRVYKRSESYYLDEFGYKFPVSQSYPANVLLATGNITEDFAKEELLSCIRFIENDDFWKAQIEQIHVEDEENIVLTPLFGDHLIELGSVENFEEKFRNLKTFYKKVLVNNNWSKYRTVSLKYKDQIVAKRK